MKKSIIISLVFALLLFYVPSIQAINDMEERPLIFDHVGRDEGLRDLSVSGIVQDKDGFIWFSTQGGLYKYNGRDMIAYRTNPFVGEGIVHNLIQTMYYDDEAHRLWLGTYQGISVLDIATNQFTNYTVEDNGLSNNIVVAITKDQHGDMWFGTMNGLNRLNQEKATFDVYEIEDEVVRTLCVDSTERLLIGTYKGIAWYDETENKVDYIDIEYPSAYVMSIKEFEEGVLTVGMWDGGVMTLDLSFNIIAQKDYEDNRVYALWQGQDETLWVGTWGGGLFKDTKNHITHYEGSGREGDIGHTIVYSFLEDRNQTIWIGTNGDGVYKTNTDKENYLILKNTPEDEKSIDAGKINDLFKDQKGQLWVSIYYKGVNVYNEKTKKITKYNEENGLPHNQIMDIITYDDQMLLASGAGILSYDEQEQQFELIDVLPKDTNVYSFVVDSVNHLWVGTYLDGVYVFDEQFNEINHYNIEGEKSISDNLVYDLICDQNGYVWVATNNGLDVFDSTTGLKVKTYKEEGKETELPGNSIRVLHEMGDGAIWVGLSGGGISKYNSTKDEFETYSEIEGLADNTVIGIADSLDGQLWVATHNGMSVMDPWTKQIINLNESDGIGGYNFTSDSYRDTEGNIYFGGTFGVIKIPAKVPTKEDVLPPLYITKMSVLNRVIDEGLGIYNDHSYEFEASDNFVAFEFTAIDYEMANRVQYSYQLQGVDDTFIDSGVRNYVSYSNLRPGSYTFMVKAKTAQGTYTEPESLVFIIKKPWYQTVYAWIAYALIFVFLIYSVIKIRESRVVSRKNVELVKDSSTDPLTGVYNRRYLDTVLQDYIQLAERSRDSLTLMMLDMDDFKHINDQYGHVFGDEFLKCVTHHIVSVLTRKTDFCTRFGGDEFVIVLYDTDEVGAMLVAKRIMSLVGTISVKYKGDDISVESTVSIGIFSGIPSGKMTGETVIDNADKALYDAKTTGKNRISVFKS